MHNDEEIKKVISDGTFVFNAVFDNNTSEKVFAHKHFENPYIFETPYLMEYEEEKPVAMRWMMGMNMSYCGQKLKAIQSSDDAALSESRGFTFIKIRKASEKIMKSSGIDFVYGCFYPGNAMDIAEKLGEKNIVTLYAAKLPLNDTVYRWKRFNIPIPRCFIKTNAYKLIKKLQSSAKDCNCDIEIFENCPFAEEDFLLINSGDSLRVTRSQIYYEWKFGLLDKKSIKYITARKNGKLVGFIIITIGKGHDTIADWDVFTAENDCDKVLAALILKASTGKSILVPSLNPENHELKLFTSIGFKDARLHEAPICICTKAFNPEVSDIIYEPKNWKHRFIDADYFLN